MSDKVKVRKGTKARPTVPHKNRKRAHKRGERKHKQPTGGPHDEV